MGRMAWMACALAAVVAGCGGGRSPHAVTLTVTEPAKAPLARADSAAYREIAADSALLTERAKAILASRSASGTALERGRARLERLRPASAILESLRGALAHAIDNLLGDQTPNGARAAMKSTLAINVDLLRFNSQR